MWLVEWSVPRWRRHASTGLRNIGFKVEAGKTREQKLRVPVLFGNNGHIEKSFEADAFHEGEGFVLECVTAIKVTATSTG